MLISLWLRDGLTNKMYDEDNDLFERLQYMSITYPEKVEVYIDEEGVPEFEIEFDFFFDNLEKIFGF